MIEISDGTRQRIRALFPEGEWGRVEQVLRERCGDTLPLVDASRVGLAERIRYAVLKLSSGGMPELEHHVALAARDWRDVLLAAGFGHDPAAHLTWLPEQWSIEIPYAFAAPGGSGDIVTASLAFGLLMASRRVDQHPGLLAAWNVLGLIDILLVVSAAARLGIAQPGSMAALTRLPLSLLPTFLVPLIIASHLWLFGQLRRRRQAA